MKIRIEGFTLRLKAETSEDKAILEMIAKGKLHYYPETSTLLIF